MLLYVCLSIFFFFSLFLLEHCFAPIDSLSLLYINIIPYGFSIRMLNLGLYMGLEFRRVSGGSGTGRGRARQQDGRENIRNGDRKAPTPLCYCLYLITKFYLCSVHDNAPQRLRYLTDSLGDIFMPLLILLFLFKR